MPWRLLDRGGYDLTVDTYRHILEYAPTMLWLGDESGKCVYLNRMQREFWGVRSEEIPDFSWTDTLHPEDIEDLGRTFRTAMESREAFQVEARYMRADGQYQILHTRASPRFGSSGAFLGMVGVNADVTNERASERRVELLTGELAHRNRNLFSVVGSIASITQREAPEAAEAFGRFQTRLRALSLAHDQTTHLSGSAAPRRLHDLVDLIFAPYQDDRERITVAGHDIGLTERTATPLALILQELATNSAKYGCLSGGGSLLLLIEETANKDIMISWIEDAVADVPVSTKSTGFGRRLLDAMAADLGATITIEQMDGRYVVRLNIDRKVLATDLDVATLELELSTVSMSDREWPQRST